MLSWCQHNYSLNHVMWWKTNIVNVTLPSKSLIPVVYIMSYMPNPRRICPKLDSKIFSHPHANLFDTGVIASAASSLDAAFQGGGSNHLCMTLQPDFVSPMAERQVGRSHIYGSEYRDGAPTRVATYQAIIFTLTMPRAPCVSLAVVARFSCCPEHRRVP